jgi:hypothetical protein
MNFGFNYPDLTPFLDKIKTNELTLENILEEEEIIDDIRDNNDSEFVNFFTNDKIKKLLDYAIKLPASDSPNIGYKYPFNATEILCSENMTFQNKLMCETPIISKDVNGDEPNSLKEKIRIAKNIQKDGFISVLFNIINKIKKEKNIINIEENENDDSLDGQDDLDDVEDAEEMMDKDDNKENKKPKYIYENIDYLLQFLKESDETKENYVLVGYFYKILNNLITVQSTKIVQYLFDYPKKDEFDILSLFIKNMNRKSMCNIIYKLLVFEGEINSKFDDKKLYLIEKILDELNESNDKIKSECICDLLCLVMNNTPFFNLFITKLDLLEKLYNILFNSKNNTKKINSILKLLTKINENILQRFEVHYTSGTQDNNTDMNLNNAETGYSNDQDKSITSRGDNSESLKSILFFLFDVLEKKKLQIFEDFGNFNQEENSEFKSTYMEKQKKIGMKKIMQTAYLQTLLEIIVNSYASKYYENKIEKLMDIAKDMNLFWNLHTIFFLFPFSNIYQIYYNKIIEIVLNEHSPNCLIDAFSMEYNGEKRNIIDFYIEKIIKDMKFNFDLTETKSFNPCFSFAISLLNKIYNSQNIYVKKKIEKNKNLSVFYEIVIKEINNVYTQKLLLNTNFDFGVNEDDKNLNYFGPESLLESFEENCKIYEAYKKGENYQKLLSDKKERFEKDKKAKKKDNENIENNMGLEYIDDIDVEDDDPLFKVEKINSNKDKDNFFSILNKPRDEINQGNNSNNNNYNKENENIINDDKKDNILNMENINDEMGKMNEDSVPNQIENKIYHVDYNEIRKGN